MAAQKINNEWDGFDGQIAHYDDKKEKKYQSGIWLCLGLIGLVIIVSLIVRQVKDFIVTVDYLCVEAEYVGDGYAKYCLEDGVTKYYPIPSYPVKERDGKMLLYYQPGSNYVTHIATFSSWIIYYIFFGIITGISFYKIWTIYFGKRHVVED